MTGTMAPGTVSVTITVRTVWELHGTGADITVRIGVAGDAIRGITAAGTARTTTADGMTHGTAADGTIRGITEAGTTHGITDIITAGITLSTITTAGTTLISTNLVRDREA